MSSRGVLLGSVVVLGGAAGALLWSRRASAAEATAADVEVAPGLQGIREDDLKRLAAIEVAAAIPGLARFLATVGATESNWKIQDPWSVRNDRPAEVAGSAAAVKALAKAGVLLPHPDDAASFGSGGAFGLLLPYALAAGKPDRPLLGLKGQEFLDNWRYQVAAAADMVVRLVSTGFVKTWRQARVGWDSVVTVKKDPELTGPSATSVLDRTRSRLTERGFGDLWPLPGSEISTGSYPGMKAVLKELE